MQLYYDLFKINQARLILSAEFVLIISRQSLKKDISTQSTVSDKCSPTSASVEWKQRHQRSLPRRPSLPGSLLLSPARTAQARGPERRGLSCARRQLKGLLAAGCSWRLISYGSRCQAGPCFPLNPSPESRLVLWSSWCMCKGGAGRGKLGRQEDYSPSKVFGLTA